MEIQRVLRPMEEVKQGWDSQKVYCVAPQGIQISLHLLVKGASMASTQEEEGPTWTEWRRC